MTEPEGSGGESDDRQVAGWLRWLSEQTRGCYLCRRILFESQAHGGSLEVLDIRGVELTRDEQTAHLARCVPEHQRDKREGELL